MVSRGGGSVLTSVATSSGLTSGVPFGASASAYTYARHGFELATAYSELVDPDPTVAAGDPFTSTFMTQ